MDGVNQPTESITKLEEINNRITMAESEHRRLQGLSFEKLGGSKSELAQIVNDATAGDNDTPLDS